MERAQVIENIRQVAASVLPKGSFKVNLPEMKRSSILEERRKQVNPEIRATVDLSFQIVDRIHEILTEKGLKQKDLAMLLGKEEVVA